MSEDNGRMAVVPKIELPEGEKPVAVVVAVMTDKGNLVWSGPQKPMEFYGLLKVTEKAYEARMRQLERQMAEALAAAKKDQRIIVPK